MQFGIALIFILPDFPDTWKALSPEERHVANRRLAIEAAEADVDVDNDKPMSQLRGIKLALTDPKTYLLALAYHGQTGAAGIQNYFPTLTQTITSTHIEALLLCAPPYLFMVVWSFVHCRVSDRFGHRFWFFVYPIPITIVGFVSMWKRPPLLLLKISCVKMRPPTDFATSQSSWQRITSQRDTSRSSSKSSSSP